MSSPYRAEGADPEPYGLIGSDPYAPTPDAGRARAIRDEPVDPYGPAHGFGAYGPRGAAGMKADYIAPGTRLPVDRADLADNSGISAFAHWGTLLLGFWPPLIIWLSRKDRSPYARLHAAESLNFMVIMLIAYAIAGALTAVLIGVFAFPVLYVWQIVATLRATGAANRGEMPGYWLPFRLFR